MSKWLGIDIVPKPILQPRIALQVFPKPLKTGGLGKVSGRNVRCDHKR